MSTSQEKAVTTAADTQEPGTPPDINYAQLAIEVCEGIKRELAKIPGFNDDLSGMKARERRVADLEFVNRAVNAAASHERLGGIEPTLVADSRDDRNYDEFRSVRELTASSTRQFDLLFLRRGAGRTRSASRLYRHSERLLTESPRDTMLRTLVESMREVRPRRRKAAPPAPPTAPSAPLPPEKGGETNH